MKSKHKCRRMMQAKRKKVIALFLLISIINDLFFPAMAFALTGGPSQPEVQSFEPIGTSDMVDLFSGDFNYNIPLMDVGGYPINISYHGGITMDQEASWVGLGWNINPGVVNRGVRGIPDDFNGDGIVKTYNMKPNRTYGVTAGLNLQIFGQDNLGSLDYSVGIRYNNYTGIAMEKSLSLSVSASTSGSSSLTGSLGLNSSSDEGLTIQPSVSFSAKQKSADLKNTMSMGISAGGSYNSRAGLKTLSINVNASASQNYTSNRKNAKKYDESNSLASAGASATWDFGMPTFTPQVSMAMHNSTFTGSFQLGGEIWGLDGAIKLSGYFAQQKLITSNTENPAYGYNYLENGQNSADALLDFNREKDGSFNENTPCLPLTNLSYDIYSVSGQGIGGSYRPFRSEIGYVFDSRNYTTTDNGSLAVDVGLGAYFHGGTDISFTDVDATSGAWLTDNLATAKLKYSESTSDPLYEKVYYKEANEKVIESDPALFQQMGGYNPQRFELNENGDFYTVLGSKLIDQNGNSTSLSNNKRTKRDKRNQPITVLHKNQYDNFAIEPIQNQYSNAKSDHVAEITTLSTNGSRYVYGIAAYNTLQEEVTFAVGDDELGNGALSSNCETGLLTNLTPSEINSLASVSNSKGIDNYYNSVATPGFAHAYLLTSILSPDYVDADNTRGPSDGDLGDYTKIEYDKIASYKWRTPETSATYNEGLKSDTKDDKANFVYGEKELYYVNKIITKNYIAIFETGNRHDAHGVDGRQGGVNTSQNMKYLKRISLYSKPNYKEHQMNSSVPLIPLKEVYFEYDYSLCKGIKNNDELSEWVNNVDINAEKGKLTLKKLYFSYQNSNKAKLSPYKFSYSNFNPAYNIKGYNRWGNYKKNDASSCNATDARFPTSEFPYVEQDKAIEDVNSSAWCLKEISLPSGGKIIVEYESDDYAYVQNQRAMQMFKIFGVGPGDFNSLLGVDDRNLKNLNDGGKKLHFQLVKDANNNYIIDPAQYFDGKYVYFRFLMEMKAGMYEYIPGYAEIENYGIDPANGFGWVQLKKVKLRDDGSAIYDPIIKAAIQFGRMNMPKQMYQQPNVPEGSGVFQQALQAIINSSFANNISQAISGPNLAIYNNGYCKSFVPNKSFIRLLNPNKNKLGGGCRVKSIKMSDEWASMISGGNPTTDNFEYGQTYQYKLEDGISSSGVACYEPQLGGDENPFRKPVFFDIEKALSPDDQLYTEEPFGESFFPSPSVGYSRVTVTNLKHSGVTKHATGYVVHEFYTAKDFPTIVLRSGLEHDRDKSVPLSIASLLNIDVKDYVTATQGFSIEVNDMHGKTKGQKVYQEGQITPITEVEYKYKSTVSGDGTQRLNNQVTAILPNGNITSTQIGVMFDMVADMREQRSVVNSATIPINVDIFPVGPFPASVFMVWPSFSHQETQFRSATTTKVIQRFGILERTIAKDLGSQVETNNLAYDSETGEVLLTQTKTNFNDDIFTMNFPAHWYYEGMANAYKNVGVKLKNVNFSSISNANKYFIAGDEISIDNSTKAWVTTVTNYSITAVDKFGTQMNLLGLHDIQVLRSGRRNTPSVSIGSINGLANPLAGLSSNLYDKVIQASAIELTEGWKTFCDCPLTNGNGMYVSTNPYILGIKGFWKPKKSYLHLTGRTQSKYNGNTNIRRDGMFTSFTPFYKNVSGNWQIDYKNWTYTTEITEYSPYGQEIENKDALGRFSSATFGYNQSLPTAVSSNARYKEIGFDNFEDYDFSECADNHFKFKRNQIYIDRTDSHTGRRSIKVSAGNPVSLTKQLSDCLIKECNLKFNVQGNVPSAIGLLIGVSNSNTSYSFSYNIISGSPNVSLTNNGANLVISGSPFQVEVTATDLNGCTISQLFQQ